MSVAGQALFGRVNDVLERFLRVRIKRVRKVESLCEDIPHDVVLPMATYAPWLGDAPFEEVYDVAKAFTLVDRYRLYELYHLARQAVTFRGAFIEIGVWRGGSSAVIQKAIAQACSPSDRPRFIVADTFKGVVKASGVHDTTYKGGEHADASIDDVKEVFARANLDPPEILVGIFPDDHPSLTVDGISFVHSDVDAYQSTKGIIEWCLPRLTKQAVIVFDDYGFRGCEGVARFVNEFMRSHQDDFLMVHNLNGHAILIKK